MKTLTTKQAQANAKKEIKRILKDIQEEANANIEKVLKSNPFSENSDFMKDNALLALAALNDEIWRIRFSDTNYRKEAEEIQRFM